MTGYLIGVDLGTSSLKALLLDDRGRSLFTASAPYQTLSPLPGYAEQEPGDWYAAMALTVRKILRETGIHKKDIQGLGFSGQMHGLVCTAEDGQPVRRAIVWTDRRSGRQVKQILAAFGSERYGALAGNPLTTGFLFPSWIWVCENEPASAGKTRHLLLPKDYLRSRVCGSLCSDPSDAAATGMFDIAKGTWCAELVDEFGVDRSILPEIRPSHRLAGVVNQTASEDLDLVEGIPVIVGGGDTPVQALGRGILKEGDLSLAISTGGNILAFSSSPRVDPKLQVHCMNYVIPGTWYNMAATLSGGASFRWLKENFANGLSYTQLADLAWQAGTSEGLFFLPHLLGERTPYMDAESKGMFIGLTAQHGLGHLARAVMEGVVFSLRLGLETLKKLGVPVQSILVSGGGVRHPLWLRLIADIFNHPLTASTITGAAPLGAAILAGVGSGVFANFETACSLATVCTGAGLKPDPQSAARYEREYEKFLRLYPLVKEFLKSEENPAV